VVKRCATLLQGVRAGRISNDMTSNKRRRHTPDQIIRKLVEGNKILASGQELDEVCRHLEIAESTWHRWLAQCGGMKANDAKRLKEPEAENAVEEACRQPGSRH
jgi:putative transposase